MNIFFDLDGTLTDPADGITRCIEYAVTAMGTECPPREELKRFIGPPLKESLRTLLSGTDEQELDRAVELYRERFASVGMYENRVFDGIASLLSALTKRGDSLWVVTAKPREYAERILSHFQLHHFFVGVYGPELGDHSVTKGELIGQLLADHTLNAEQSIMIGDRSYDGAAACDQGMQFVGVLWGFGSPEELEDAGADYLASSPEEIEAIVRKDKRTSLTTRIDEVRPDAPELAERGEFDTGVRTINLVNPDQLDVVAVLEGSEGARYDRPLTVELWYPADSAQEQPADAGRYEVNARDGSVASLCGSSVRDAAPNHQGAAYPLVIVSHGYPGNRYLLSHFGEFLASHGYVVASIDHTDSTYTDQGVFASTLRNRSLDQLFVLDELARLSAGDSEFLEGLVDAERTGIIGYSMGGYGLLNTIGAGLSDSAHDTLSVPENVLENRLASSEEYPATLDSRVKAAVAIAPWGVQLGLWSAAALSNVETPVFFMSGSVDDVSGYEDGPRVAFREMSCTKRFFLTFENANHNAAAPIPAPREVFESGDGYDHYADAVWDNVRMNNIAQHYVAAFFGRELRDDSNMDRYLVGSEFEGFPDRTTAGLRFDYRAAGE